MIVKNTLYAYRYEKKAEQTDVLSVYSVKNGTMKLLIDGDFYDDDEGDDDTIRLTTAIKKKWENHYTAEVTIKNLTDASIDDWTIGFQCKDEIEKISKAKIIGYQKNYYYVQSLDGRQDIKANGKVTFEITVKYKGTINEINSEFCADDC